MVCVVLDGCREQGVDKGRLSQTRFACDLGHMTKCKDMLEGCEVTMIVNAAPRLATILCLKAG